MYSYTLDGISFSDPLGGIDDMERTIIREWSGTDLTNILRTKSETTLTFSGRASDYIQNQQNSFCDKVRLNVFNINGNLFYEGDIFLESCSVNLTKNTCETPVRDTTWSSLLIDRSANKVYTLANKSFDCSTSIVPPTKRRFNFFLDSMTLATPAREGYLVLELIQHTVNYLTNNQITVASQYLTDNPYALIIGSEMSNTFGAIREFSISFEELIVNVRKLFNLYMIISGNTLTIEPESNAFQTGVSFTIGQLPYDITKTVNVDRMISEVTVGRDDDPSNSYTSNLPFALNKWDTVQYGNCACTFDKETSLDLSPEWIIDSDIIRDSLLNGGYERDLFLIELNDTSLEPQTFVVVPFAAIYFNNSLRNSFVLQRWETYILNCILQTTENSLFRSVGTEFTNNQSFNLIFDNFVFSQLTCNLLLRYPNVQIDPLNQHSQPSQGVVCGSVSQQYSMYTIPQSGKYAFRASKVFKWDTQAATFATVDRVLTIQVYTNSTLSSLAFSWQTQEIGVVIPPNGLPENPLYYVDDMSVTTPVWTIPAGHVVVVRFSYIVRVGLSLSISIVDGVFEYAAELLQCENIIDPAADNYPFKYSFQYPLCDNEWDFINANKPDIIRLLGVDMYLSEITQSLKGIATFNLISNTNLIACAQQSCVWRVEGVLQYEFGFFEFTIPETLTGGTAFTTLSITHSVGGIAGFAINLTMSGAATRTRESVLNAIAANFNNLSGAVDIDIDYETGVVKIISLAARLTNPPLSPSSFTFQSAAGQYTNFDYCTGLNQGGQIILNGSWNCPSANNLNGGFWYEQSSNLTFQIFQNGNWTTVTPTDGVYESTTEFTAWRIIDSEDNVIESGEPEIICT
jgi:hypothetical protein